MTATTSPDARRTAPLGGLSATFVGLELRRLLRNRRSVIFTLVAPAGFFLAFGTPGGAAETTVGRGNLTAYIAISMALYGAMIATSAAGASVSVERAQGWSRQLRLTPLRPVAYVAVKVAVAMVSGLAAVLVVLTVAAFSGARMPLEVWVSAGLIAWAGSLVFAALGLFVGYLLPSENVMQLLGPGLALLAFAGGVFIPLGDSGWFPVVARLTPMYGLATLARAPLATGDGGGALLVAVLNVVVWAAVFVLGAAAMFRRDTSRV